MSTRARRTKATAARQRIAVSAQLRRARRNAIKPLAVVAATSATVALAGAFAPSGASGGQASGGDAVALLTNTLNPGNLTDLDGTLFFTADDHEHGEELWMSDGTAAGTALVKDINPANGSNPRNLTSIDGLLYFTAFDAVHGRELWRSDGTAAGTTMVRDINPGGADAFSAVEPAELTKSGGAAFFWAEDGEHGKALWRTDGTTEGTAFVKDLEPAAWLPESRHLAEVDGTLFAGAVNGLWKSDGTTEGTVLVMDLDHDPYAYDVPNRPVDLTDVGGTLFFTADDDEHGRELWTSDGTDDGTVLVKDIQPGTGDYDEPYGSRPAELTAVGDTLFFSAFRDGLGIELWKSDGTADGTVVVKDIKPGSSGGSSRSAYPRDLVAMGGDLYFVADDRVHGWELWRSSGTAATTSMVAEINPSAKADYYFPPLGGLTPLDDTLYLAADDGSHGWELWASDGTASGTRLVVDLVPPGSLRGPSALTAAGSSLYFTANVVAPGRGVWKLVTGPHGPTCSGVVATIKGGGTVTGTAGDDVILGSARADTIAGQGGSDIVCGSGGGDKIVGGPGSDLLRGGTGTDDLVLRDRIRGNDVGHGGRGNDTATKDRGDRLFSVP